MVRVSLLASLMLVMLLSAVSIFSQAAPAQNPSGSQQPLLVFLYSRFTDPANVEITEDRIRNAMEIIDHVRSQNVVNRPIATFFFAGASSEALAQRNSSTHIVDFVKDAAHRGLIEIGYDGLNEIEYDGMPDAEAPASASVQARWKASEDAARQVIARGLAKTEQVFGPVATIANITDEPARDLSYVELLSSHPKFLMLGFPQPDPNRHVVGYRGSLLTIGKLAAPASNDSPELIWQNSVLRLSEMGEARVHPLRAQDTADAVLGALRGADRSHIQIYELELGSEDVYLAPDYASGRLYPPARYAHEHPDHPSLPAEAFRDKADVRVIWNLQDWAVKSLFSNFFGANPGSTTVTGSQLLAMTPPADGFTVSGSDLKAAAKTIVDQWPSNFAPSFVQAGSRYLSDAEIFFALATALSDWGHDHKLPETVKISSVFGPLSFTDDAGPGAGQVRLSDLAQECARLVSTMRNTGSSAVPQNVVPERVTIGGLNLNAAQVLYAMASAVSSLPATIPIRTAHMSTPIGEDYPLIVPLGKLRAVPRSEMGAVWTIKPAPLDVKSATH